jgi:predicted dehydrogenase
LTTNDGYLVLIVGCGDLGSRHLQAVASLDQVGVIELVDPRPEALEFGRQRLAEIENCSPTIEFRWLSSLEQATKGGDLCIVATQAEGRGGLVQEVVRSLGYFKFILEKIVAQSVEEIEGLIKFSVANKVSAWVNCKTRAVPLHQTIRKNLRPEEPVSFSTVGGNWGLATNGVHLADTFAFYDGSPTITSTGGNIDPILHPSKRGDEIFDLSGTLHGHTEKGSQITISYLPDSDTPEIMSVATKSYRCIIDHAHRWVFDSDVESGWSWRQVPFNDRIFVSEMTIDFAANILATGRCALPTLEESLVSHRFILNELQPHFSRLLKKELVSCPVT